MKREVAINRCILSIIRNKLLPLEYEVCGVLENDEELLPVILAKGRLRNGRKSCLARNDRYIFHTHILGDKGYPSAEDYIQVLKAGSSVRTSVIFTEWGIWEIGFSKKKRQDFSEFIPIINEAANGMYHVTDRGRNFQRRHTGVVKDYITNVRYALKEFRAKVSFTSWEQIGTGDYYVRNI